MEGNYFDYKVLGLVKGSFQGPRWVLELILGS